MLAADAPTIAVCFALAHRPGRGGHAWVVLNWLLGLRRLGYRPLLVDRLAPDMVGTGPGAPADVAAALAWVHAVVDPHGLGDDVAVLGPDGSVLDGPDRAVLTDRVRDSVALVDVMGFCGDDDLLAAAPVRVGLDVDPGFGQLWAAAGLADPFRHHDRLVTVGLNVGTPGCRVPDLGRRWVPTLPPVALEHWPDLGPGPARLTSVGAWRGPYAPLDDEAGGRLGLRVHSARPLLDLPARAATTPEVAWELDPADDADRRALEDHGWRLVDPAVAAADPDAYRAFVARSGAELCVAKEIYVATRSGWFSDRSAVYLASGRPVVATDTGLAGHLPLGAGLLAVDGLDATCAAVRTVLDDLPTHAAAARAVAEEHLDSDVVLTRLLDALDLT